MAHAPNEPSVTARTASLITQYLDVLEANRIAIEHLESERNRALACELRITLEEGVRALSSLLVEHGQTPPTQPDARRFVKDAKVTLAEAAGDRGVLGALKSNEKSLLGALERESRRASLSSGLAERVEKERAAVMARIALLDERLEDLRDGAHVLS